MPGLFLIRERTPIAVVIQVVLAIDDLTLEGEWDRQICYLPL